MKKIFPVDWEKMHPGNSTMSTDGYYTQLANKVLEVLQKNHIQTMLTEDAWMLDAAVRITAWFEDLCNGTKLWSVVNTVCRRRHGKPLPFYDTTDYYPDEPNPQDIQLLLWDILQSHFHDGVINPLNPGIALTAADIFDIFYDEYETAPETDEMIEFLANQALETDYWQARKAMEWFALDSYLSLRTQINFEKFKHGRKKDKFYNLDVYAWSLQLVFTNQENLLSLTAAEWLSAATGFKMDLDKSLFHHRVYDITSHNGDTILIKDRHNGKETHLQTDSFQKAFVEGTLPTTKSIMCYIIGFNGKYYQAGAMAPNPADKLADNCLKKLEETEQSKQNAEFTASLFPKASGGEPIVFVKGIDEYMDFQTQKMGSKITDNFRQEMERHLRQNAESGMAALMADQETGILTILSSIPAIKAPNNPYYDKEYAQQYALQLIVEPNFIDYSALCTLIDLNYLPDAALTSNLGYEYGQLTVQKNIQFFADYFFSEHR